MRTRGPRPGPAFEDGPQGSLIPEDRGPGPRDDTDATLHSEIDRVIDDHKVLIATLDRDIRSAGHPGRTPQETGRTSLASQVPPGPSTRLADSFVAERAAARRRRARVLEEIERPPAQPATKEAPIVTRHGVLRVEADFSQLAGIGTALDARLFAAGIRTAEGFMQEPLPALAEITGLDLDALRKVREDLDLAHLGGMGSDAADLLRVIGIHSVSALAQHGPQAIEARIEAESRRHQGMRVPSALRDKLAIGRLVSLAKHRQA